MPAPQSCPACGGPLSRWRQVPSSDPVVAPGAFALLRCRRCGTAVTVEPAPPEIHNTGAYGGGRPRLSRLASPLLGAFDRHRLRLLRRGAPAPARLLDAGAGRGRFLAHARAAGYLASGIEPSARGVAGAAEIGVEVMAAGIGDAAIPAGSLDAVTLWHVLEHVDDPGAALATIHGWLRPHGWLLVGVPDLSSLQARIGGERWFHLDVPRHRTHFTADGVSALLAASGFTVEASSSLLLEHNPFGMWQSIASRVTRTPSYLYHLLKRSAPLRAGDLLVTLAMLPLIPVAALVEAIAGLAGRGGTVAVLARRHERPEYD